MKTFNETLKLHVCFTCRIKKRRGLKRVLIKIATCSNWFFFQSLQSGNTPLHNASLNGYNEIVEMLLKAGANHSLVNEVTNYKN